MREISKEVERLLIKAPNECNVLFCGNKKFNRTSFCFDHFREHLLLGTHNVDQFIDMKTKEHRAERLARGESE